jgi:hypothetical protein
MTAARFMRGAVRSLHQYTAPRAVIGQTRAGKQRYASASGSAKRVWN